MSTHTLATALALAVAAPLAGQDRTGRELVTFPDSDTAGVLDATVDRGNILHRVTFMPSLFRTTARRRHPLFSGTVQMHRGHGGLGDL
jgi:hypothetical protein